MIPRLKSITVENFRSIRGQISVSLDAPVVLIHGQNGSGKTSLLSALELALTGAVPSLRRVEPDYLEHLPHKAATDGAGRVALEVTGLNGRDRASLRVTQKSVEEGHLLSNDSARFFSERCYLAQATLGRLLEIYQHQDTRKTDSPLTRFVKDLLGLDHLDALVDGLYSAGDVRRLRDPVPAYWAARQDIPAIEHDLARLRQEQSALDTQIRIVEERLRGRLGILLPDLQPGTLDITNVQGRLHGSEDEAALLSLARVRRDLTAIAEQWQSIAVGSGASGRQIIEQEDAEVRRNVERWKADVGASLELVINELRVSIPNLQTSATAGPEVVRAAAAIAVETELHRITDILVRDAGDEKRISDLHQSIEQGKARTEVLDQQIVEAAGGSEGLAQALSEIVPHIHNEDCPVCGRDFSEISIAPLGAHLSARISALVETSGRLQALARDKATTGAAIAVAERELGSLTARRVDQKQRDDLKSKRARLEELRVRLAGLREGSAQGVVLEQRAAMAAKRLADLRSVDGAATSLRQSVEVLASQLFQPALDIAESVDAGTSRLRRHVEKMEHELTERQAFRRAALGDVEEMRASQSRRNQIAEKMVPVERKLERLSRAKAEADRHIDLAKELARHTRETRTSIVRRVFNDELNTVWRDLFVRLAPEEPFIPAFALPGSPTGPVEAVLETHYRAGGKGGNPRAMLSAGNLNTAALTLFLALHLSVKPTLPWLVIDDPVQSMDEVHISQFAALLRTLSKQNGRQLIIAVHERPLFEYLALELGPAYLDDRLITIELARAADGMTTAVWEPKTYEPDRAIAA